MSDEIEVHFSTQSRREVPTIGQRRKVRVNGRFETKYVKRVNVQAAKLFVGEPLFYRGSYTLSTADGMWG